MTSAATSGSLQLRRLIRMGPAGKSTRVQDERRPVIGSHSIHQMGLLTPLAIRVGRLRWLPALLPRIVRIDEHLQRLTRGRVTLLRIAGLPNLTLTVAGRKTGLLRTIPLLCVPFAGTYLIAGSNFGGPREPDWARNLEAALAGVVRIKGVTHPCTARPVAAEERAEVWQHMLRTWPNFAEYQEGTTRTIKIFQLTLTR